MAVFPIQRTTNPHQTREPRGPSPSGGKTPANQLFHEQPSAHRARSGVKGYYPLREPWHLSCHGGLCAIVTGNPTNPRAARSVAERRYFRSQLARLPNTPAPYGRGAGSRAARGRRKAGCPWDNPVCLWQTELFKFYLKSSPSPSGHNRRRRLATDSRQPKRGFGTAVPKTTIEVADHCPCLSGRWLRGRIRRTRGSSRCRRR